MKKSRVLMVAGVRVDNGEETKASIEAGESPAEGKKKEQWRVS